jgi:hypothetical protein
MTLKPATYSEALDRSAKYQERRKAKLALKLPQNRGKGNGLQGRKSQPQGTLRTGKHSLRPRKGLRAKPDPKMAAWSRAVRDRDGNRCQWPLADCLNRGTLHAHHKATRSRRPDLIYDLENGVTLCFLHHQWVHNHPIEAEAAGLLSSETFEAAQKAARVKQS